jgi:hypothetical protein
MRAINDGRLERGRLAQALLTLCLLSGLEQRDTEQVLRIEMRWLP